MEGPRATHTVESLSFHAITTPRTLSMHFSRTTSILAAALGVLLATCHSTDSAPAEVQSDGRGLDRTALPIHEPAPPSITELDARKAQAPARFEVKAPKGAPNVVIVLIDDIG